MAIAARTFSGGTSVSRRRMMVALSPPASWLSWAARMLTSAPPSSVPILPSAPLIAVVDDQVETLGTQVEVAAVDLDEFLHLLRARQRAGHVECAAVGVDRTHIHDAAVVGGLSVAVEISAVTPRSAARAGGR